MDYTSKETRKKLYRERNDISDFGVDDVHNLTSYMKGAFLRLKITDMENMAECMLDAFNNAYYITIAILQETNPSAYRAQFMKIALSVRTDNEVYRTQFAVLTMTMVINILQVYDKKYQTPIEITRAFLEECIKRECEKISSIDTYLLFTENLLDMSEEWRGVQYDRINRDDFIPLTQQSEEKLIENEDKQSLIALLNEVKLENVRLKDENYNLKNDIGVLHEEAASDNIKELKDKLKRTEEHYKSTLIALLKPTFLGSEKDARDFLEKINGLDNEGVANVMNQFADQEKVDANRKKRRTWEILTAAKLYSAEEQTWSHHMRKSD